MKKLISLLVLIPILAALPEDAVILGYISGNDYLELDSDARTGWLIGVMDGIMAESLVAEKDSDSPWLGNCVDGLAVDQIRAIFEKELTGNPESWHAPAALIFRAMMQDFCKREM